MKTYLKDLKKMDIGDLRFLCKQVGITYNIKNSKNTLVKKLLRPLKKIYKMSNEEDELLDRFTLHMIQVDRMIKNDEYTFDEINKKIEFIENNIIKDDISTKLYKLMTSEITKRKMTLDRYLLFNTKPNWNQIYEIKEKIKQGHYYNDLYSDIADDKKNGCLFRIQSALNSIVKEYPQIDNEKDRKNIALLLGNYCESFNKDI